MEQAFIAFTQAEIAAYYAARLPKLNQAPAREWRGTCPLHDGKHDNFAVERDTGRWYCHSGCQRGGDIISLERELSGADFRTARDEVFRTVGRAGSFNNNEKSTRKRWHKVALYTYFDEAKKPLFRVVRRERYQEAEREKTFHIERFEGGIWTKGLGTVRRVLYRLPEILEAAQVFICEGEKDADTVVDWGLDATTCPMGAGRWLPEYSPHFQHRHAVVLADNDDAGRAHALQIATDLLPLAASVRILELPNLLPKGDVTDWKCAGGTREQLLDLSSRTESMTPAGLEKLAKDWTPTSAQEPAREGSETPRSVLFQVTDAGVFFLKENASGTTDCVRIAARVDVVAKTRDAVGESWGRLLRWRDEEGRLHQWTMPMEMLASDTGAVRARLLSEGLPYIIPNARLRERFAEYLQTAPVQKYAKCVSRVGWHEDVYVLPDCAIGPVGNEEILYQTPNEASHNWNTKGSADQWREHVGQRCSGNSRLIIAASCGFAGPLLSLFGAESGGVHFYGGSSTGKTTALIVGGSVCGGGGQQGFLQTWRTTINGLEAMAEAHNDGTLFLDELAQVDPRDAAEAAYLLGNGQGKGRMNRSFGARQRLRWTLLYVSSGETTLAEHAATAGRATRGGAEVRMLLATEWGLTGWRQGEAIEAAERCFHEWLKGRGTTGSSDIEAAIRQLCAFLESNGSSRFQPLNPALPESGAERIINRAGFKRLRDSGEETEYIILPEVFKSEVCRGYNHTAVLKALDKRGFLVREKPNLTIKRQLPELGKIRVYCVRAAVLDRAEC